MPQYRIGKLGGRFVLVWTDRSGKRRRYRLDARDAGAAAHEAPGLFAILNRPKGRTVAEIWQGFIDDHAGRAILATMPYHWKALDPRFGAMPGDAITIEDCRAYVEDRRKAAVKDGSISTELGRLRMVLRWAEKHGVIGKASPIERPSPPKRKDRHLTREECRALIGAAAMPHVRLYIVLALGTGARNAALLELTWDRCDFDRQLIDLRNPQLSRPHKGRAIVPMNRPVLAALQESRPAALSDHVIEWAGRQVASVRRGLKQAAARAGIKQTVSPHLLRHSAAVHMAEAGIPMDEIAQMLGHEDVNTTRLIYARYSPNYLRKAAAVLEYDDMAISNKRNLDGK